MKTNQQDEKQRLGEEFDRILLHDAIESYLDSSDEYVKALRETLAEPSYQLSEQHEAKMDELFSSLDKKKPTLKSGRWIGRVAAAVTLMIAVASGMLVVSDASIEDVFEFFTRRLQTHTEIQLSQEIAPMYRELLKKEGCDFAYYPSYLPNQYALYRVEASKEECSLFFSKGDAYIRIYQYFIERNQNTLIHVDTENAIISFVDINGMEGEYSKKGSYQSIRFSNGDIYFIITSSQISKNQIVKVAKNLEPIEIEK